MAGYVGSTAASTASNPPVVLKSVIGGVLSNCNTGSTTPVSNLAVGSMGGKLWMYSSTNNTTDVAGVAGFFNDGPQLGMKLGDVLIGIYSTANSTTPIAYMGVLVSSAGSTSFTLATLAMTSTNA